MNEDIQECKHKETRYLYENHGESNKAVGHDCGMIICCDCGEATVNCREETIEGEINERINN